VSDVIEGDLGVDPGVVFHLALELVVHDLDGKTVPGLVDALVKLATEKLKRTQQNFIFHRRTICKKKFFWSLTQGWVARDKRSSLSCRIDEENQLD
jgi:hypothetical protein